MTLQIEADHDTRNQRDHAKAASDLGLGFVGISLFYREGYFQQSINHDNWQTEYYTLLKPENLPLEPVAAQTTPVTSPGSCLSLARIQR